MRQEERKDTTRQSPDKTRDKTRHGMTNLPLQSCDVAFTSLCKVTFVFAKKRSFQVKRKDN
jgi:hypothetical protein